MAKILNVMKGKVALFAVLIIILYAASASAQGYYADVTFDILSSGQVKILGITNHPMLSPGIYDNYTSKKGSAWLFNLTINDSFSDYIYSARLPPSSSVNYIKSSAPVRIGEEAGRITIIGAGNSEKPYLIIQYEILPQNQDFRPMIIFGAIALAGLALYLFASRQSKKVQGKPSLKNYREEALTDRQKKIIRFMESHGGSSTQALLEKELKIPKASLSRNIQTLSRKGIIKKESRGMSNLVYFPKSEEKKESDSDSGKSKIKYWN